MTRPRPFVRWVGGKRHLLPRIDPLLPPAFGAYHEPFVGGGALFFHLAATARLTTRTFLSDLNPDLIAAWTCVRDAPDALSATLTRHVAAHSPAHFRRVRDDGAAPAPLERAARCIYLANAGFNGGWRVAEDGRVSSAPGGALRRAAMTPAALRAASAALRGVDLACCDFRAALTPVAPGDLVFLDPPHLVGDVTRDPAGYTAPRYTRADQDELDRWFVALAGRDAHVVMSCAWSEDLPARFAGFHVERVDRPRVAPEALIATSRP